MFDFPTFRPNIGDHLRFNEPFCEASSISLLWKTQMLTARRPQPLTDTHQ